jgi:L-rhamnose mutarotase
MQELVQERQIKDYSIFRSSLDEVFRKLVQEDEQTLEETNTQSFEKVLTSDNN